MGHYRYLFVIKGKTTEQLTPKDIDYEFYRLYGESCDGIDWKNPEIRALTDWCELDDTFPPRNIKDLKQEIPNNFFGVAIDEEVITHWDDDDNEERDKTSQKIEQIIDKINRREIDGIVAVINCHM